jgi:hypothetical protein
MSKKQFSKKIWMVSPSRVIGIEVGITPLGNIVNYSFGQNCPDKDLRFDKVHNFVTGIF